MYKQLFTSWVADVPVMEHFTIHVQSFYLLGFCVVQSEDRGAVQRPELPLLKVAAIADTAPNTQRCLLQQCISLVI